MKINNIRVRASRVSNQFGQREKIKPRLWLWMMGIAALALALTLPLNLAFAVHGDNLFELGTMTLDDENKPVWLPGSADIEGDENRDNGPDWADIFNANREVKD
ncbi:MAG: hypothetical protein JSV42_02435, partial [Chloroflexota bacterium]